MGCGLHITDSPHHSSKLCEGHLRKSCDIQYIDLAIQYSSEGDWLEYSDNVWLKITDTVNICGLTFADACLVINFNIYFGILSLIDFLAWIIGYDNACIRSTCGMNHHISQFSSKWISQLLYQTRTTLEGSLSVSTSRLVLWEEVTACCLFPNPVVCVFINIETSTFQPTPLTWCSEFKHSAFLPLLEWVMKHRRK